MSYIKDGTLVLYTRITDVDISEPLAHEAREREVRACGSESVKREKYLVWKLLEIAVKEHTTLDFANLEFTKNDNGQWVCPDICFSLSHTSGALCVAVSRHPVGVDIEKVRPLKSSIFPRFLTDGEREYMVRMPKEQRENFFLTAWVKKESIFKRHAGRSLMPRDIDTLGNDASVSRVLLDGEEYLIAAVADNNEKCEIRFMEEI